MATEEIPLVSDTDAYSLEVSLDGTLYALRMTWNERAASWFMDVRLPTQNESVAVALQCPLVVGTLPTAGVWTNGPLGQLVVIGERDPQRDDLGTRTKLVYVPIADLQALAT